MIHGAPARIVAVMRRHPDLLPQASQAAQLLCSWDARGEYKARFITVGGGDLFIKVYCTSTRVAEAP
jgi:hypothetical protein